MKITRKTSFLVALLFLFLTLLPAGCAHKAKSGSAAAVPNPQRMEEMYGMPAVSVLVDLPIDNGGIGGDLLTKTLQYLPGFEKDFMVCAETLPNYRSAAERDAAATRIRTELMAGKGPDLFICAHPLYGYTAGLEDMPFFQFPEQAMDNRVFLPLDDYMKKAEYMEWDKLVPAVMQAGQRDGEQLLLPLSFFFTATLYPKKDYTPSIALPATWEQMIESGEPALVDAVSGLGLQNMMGRLADFSSDTLLFSEEELLRLELLQLNIGKAKLQETGLFEEGSDDPDAQRPVVVSFDRSWDMGLSDEALNDLKEGDSEYSLIPPYNTEGGITAYVTAFAAVNSNAKYPDLAFRIADYLLGKEAQHRGALNTRRMEGMPVYREAGNEELPFDLAGTGSRWYMKDSVFQEYQKLLDQINVVRFPGPLDASIWTVFGSTEKEMKESVHAQYMKMQMHLAES